MFQIGKYIISYQAPFIRKAERNLILDTDFIPLEIKENKGNPVYGPVNLKRPYDAKRWVTNPSEMFVYRQDNRHLNEILFAGGFQPRSLELDALEDHMLKASGYTYISTSNIRLRGGSYGKYEYAIRLKADQGINTDEYLKARFRRLNKKPARIIEYSIPGPISPEKIIGWRTWP